MRIRTAFVGTREGTHGQECGQKGFTLLETAIIMIFVAIVAGMVMLSWSSFAETRRIARARSQLRQMKDCLMRVMLVTEHYPRGAYVLAGLGRDGRACDATYDRLDTRPWAEIPSAGSHPSPPHFQAGGDDIVLAVKAYELSAAIRHAVGP